MPSPESISAYVGCAGSGEICLIQLHGNALALIERTSLPALETPGGSLPLSLARNRRKLYAAGRGTPLTIATFDIDPTTRTLSPVANFPVDESIAYLSCDGSDERLFSASYNQDVVTAWDISGGHGVQDKLARFATAPNAHCICLDPSGRRLLFTSLGGDRLYCASAEAQPLFSDTTEVALPEGTGPRHLVFNTPGNRLYLLGELDGSITLFDFDADTQRLETRQRVYLDNGGTGKWWASDIHISADDRYLHACERHGSRITSFAIEPDSGELSFMGSVEVEAQPRGFAIDPSGHVLLVAGQLSNHVAAWRLNRGMPEFIDRIEVAPAPDWIEIY